MTTVTSTTESPSHDTPAPAPEPLPREQVIRARRGLVGVDWDELIRHRELLGFLIWRDFKVRYKQTVLGLGWAVLQPLCFMAIFSVIATKLDFGDKLGMPVLVFYFAGLLPWTFYSVGVQFSSTSLVNQQHLLTKIYLPRVFIPTSVIVTGLIDMAIASVVFVGFMVWFGIVPNLEILMLIPLLALLILTTLGFGYLFSGLAVAYRDIRFIVPFFVQGMLFVSGVLFPASVEFVGEKGAWILAANPVTGVVEGFRAAVSGGDYAFDWPRLALSAGVGLACFAVGLTVFRQIERRFADIA